MNTYRAFAVLSMLAAAAAAVFLFVHGNPVHADDTATQIQQLQQQEQQLQSQIDAYQNQIDTIHSQALTYQGQVDALSDQINKVTLELKSLGVSINETDLQIADTQNQITVGEGQIAQDQATLTQYLNIVYQSDQESLVTILLQNNSLSDFFNDLNSISTNEDNLKQTIDSVKQLNTNLSAQEDTLQTQEAGLAQQQALAQVDQHNLAENKQQEATLLKQAQGQESKVQTLAKQSQASLTALQNEISYLEQNGVSVNDAVKYGELAATAVGIRPAFLLAELNQESGLGANVGRCYLTDTTSGSSRNINSGAVATHGMNPTRDLPDFLQITSALGRDPLQTLISCWPGYGWGGAMGPAQFIPSTWMGYAAQVATLVGRPVADPWNVQDAFTAAAIKFAKDGAASQTEAGEIAASEIYFCGTSRDPSSVCVNYARDVQAQEADIEQNL